MTIIEVLEKMEKEEKDLKKLKALSDFNTFITKCVENHVEKIDGNALFEIISNLIKVWPDYACVLLTISTITGISAGLGLTDEADLFSMDINDLIQ